MREPFRILFPLGILLAWAGVLHWFLLAIGAWSEYRSIFHAMAQIQGFMTCFMAGFLYTFVPRRTGSRGPGWWQMGSAIVGPVGTVVCAWFEWWVPSQLFWLITMGVLVAFAFSRFRGQGALGRLPGAFIWVPTTLAISMLSAVVTGAAAATGRMWIHDIGRGMLLQGLFTGLVIGVAGSIMPMLLRNQPPVGERTHAARFFHLALIVLYWATFWIEPFSSTSFAFGMRALVLVSAMVAAGMWRRPTAPGWHRWIAWVAPWFLPLSAAVVAVWPEYRKSGLHFGFIGCFAAMAFAVSIHVTLSHGGRADLVVKRLWQVAAIAVGLLVALGARVMVDVDPGHFNRWLGIASAAFLATTVVWLQLLGPTLFARSATPSE